MRKNKENTILTELRILVKNSLLRLPAKLWNFAQVDLKEITFICIIYLIQ